MSRRGGLLAGVVAAALIIGAVAWLLAGGPEREAPASILAPQVANVAPAALPALAGEVAAPPAIEALPPATAPAADGASGDPAVAVLTCRVVLQGDGSPVADVEVVVEHDAEPSRDALRRSSARTAADGRVRFTFPDATRLWRVRALPGPGHALHDEYLNAETLQPGSEKTLELRITRGATLAGTVIDERKDLLPHADVSVWCDFRSSLELSPGFAVEEPDLRTTTDGAGHFVVEGVGPRFVAMAGAPGKAAVTGFGGPIREGEVLDGVQLVLGPAAELHGRVLDAAHRPLAKVRVQAICGPPGEYGGPPATEPPLKVVAVTDEAGRFALAPLAARKWRVEVTQPPYAPWTGKASPDGTELQIVLTSGCALSGRVLGADGAPLAGAQLGLSGASEDKGYGPTGWAAQDSGADGRFHFEGLIPTQEAQLSVTAPGHAVQVVQPVVVSAEAREELELRLEAERVIAGQVVDEQGQPLAGAGVSVRGDRVLDSRQSSKPTWESVARVDSALTGADGRFRLDRLYDGEFALTASDPRHAGLTRTLNVRSGVEDLLVRLDPAELRGAVLQGTVRDGLSGVPVPEFSLWLTPATDAAREADHVSHGGNFHAPSGAFSLQGIPPGDYLLSVYATGYAPSAQGPWTLEAGERTLDLTLLPERTLRLRAVDQDGAPVSMAYVSFEDSAGVRLQLGEPARGDGTFGATDKRGEVTAQGLPAAQVVVVLKVSRARGFFGAQAEHRFPFDLRQEPVGVQQVVVPRDKQRLLVVMLFQEHEPKAGPVKPDAGDAVAPPAPSEPASALTGLDPTDAATNERFKAHYLHGSLVTLAQVATVTLRAESGEVLQQASATPSGENAFELQSPLFTGTSPMPNLLLALPHDATTVEVSAPGCAPASLALPAGDGNLSRVVVLGAAD